MRWCRPYCGLVNGAPCRLDQGNRLGVGLVGHLYFALPVLGCGFSEGVTGRAASCCACVHSGLGFSGHLPHCLGGRAALPLLICVWAEGSRWATNRGSLLGVTPGFMEGHCTSHGTLVCRWGCADVRKPELLRWVRVMCTLAQRRRGSVWGTRAIQAHCFGERWILCAFPVETSAQFGL